MFFLSLILVLFAAHGQPPALSAMPKPPAYADSDAYKIYSLLLPKEIVWKAGRILAIQAETNPGPPGTCFSDDKDFLAEYGGLIEAFKSANRKSVKLQRKFHLAKEYELVSDRHPRKEYTDWKGKSGGYIIVISAVGFNANRTRALVMIEHICEGNCGGGRFHFLEKKGSEWQEESDFISKETKISPDTSSITIIQKSCGWAF